LPTLPEITTFDIVLKPNSGLNPASPPMSIMTTAISNLGVILGVSGESFSGRSILLEQGEDAAGIADAVSAEWHLLQLDFRPSDPHRWLFRLDGVMIDLKITVSATPGNLRPTHLPYSNTRV
ncbi:MAG TPA: hypothetical protein VHQ91_03320, partial [Geminicoccaceae bacterium]|nr:hypothetical protein [Geminicoccaceae bacterium]